MNIPSGTVAILERTSVGTFPVTKCSFSVSDTCATHTNHYCQFPSSRGSVIIDEIRVCGKPFCNLCAIHCGYESHTRCPSCHPESSLKKNATMQSETGETYPTSDAPPTADLCTTPQSIKPYPTVPVTMKEMTDEVLKCESLYCDDEEFFKMMQDPGEELEVASRCKNGYWKSKKEPDRQYALLKKAGEEFEKKSRSSSYLSLRCSSLYSSMKL